MTPGTALRRHSRDGVVRLFATLGFGLTVLSVSVVMRGQGSSMLEPTWRRCQSPAKEPRG